MAARACVGAVLAVLLVAASSSAQDVAPRGSETYTNPELEQATLLSRQVTVLEIIKSLRITNDQAAVMYDSMGRILAAQRDLTQRIESLVGSRAQAIDGYVVAAFEDSPESFHPATLRDVDDLLSALTRLGRDYRALCQQEYARVYETLTEAQRAGIETREERAFKAALASRASAEGGTRLDAVVQSILDVRRLDPPAYRQQAEALATQIARSLVGNDPQVLRPVADRVLTLMEVARALPPDPSPAALDDFTRQVRSELQLRGDAMPPPADQPGDGVESDCVTQDGFEALMRDPIAFELIGKLLGAEGPATGGDR